MPRPNHRNPWFSNSRLAPGGCCCRCLGMLLAVWCEVATGCQLQCPRVLSSNAKTQSSIQHLGGGGESACCCQCTQGAAAASAAMVHQHVLAAAAPGMWVSEGAKDAQLMAGRQDGSTWLHSRWPWVTRHPCSTYVSSPSYTVCSRVACLAPWPVSGACCACMHRVWSTRLRAEEHCFGWQPPAAPRGCCHGPRSLSVAPGENICVGVVLAVTPAGPPGPGGSAMLWSQACGRQQHAVNNQQRAGSTRRVQQRTGGGQSGQALGYEQSPTAARCIPDAPSL